MHLLLRTSTLLVLFSSINLAKTEEKPPANSSHENTPPALSENYKETKLPIPPPVFEDLNTVSLDDAIKMVVQDSKNKILGAKTEIENGKKIHIIKVLTPEGYIQYIRIDAVSGKILGKAKK